MSMPELLSPVGGKAHLIAAVNNGADAVYMGGMAFNARIFADNFSDEELPEAVRYAHMHGVKVYMTLNTLVRDDELVRAFEYANYIYGIGVDALIVQDIGLARMLHKYIPELPLHLSTQGTLYNVEAMGLAKDLGFCRVVPARELSLEEIKMLVSEGREISPDAPVEVEVFVHGALCMCYSGQCQMSRMMGRGSGRTGNRGTCAQPCRQAYTDDHGRTYYALSPKDLCQIQNIPDLVSAGVSSFKIEGRIKSPEYVATVTRIYRKYIDVYERLLSRYGADEAKKRYRVDDEDMLELNGVRFEEFAPCRNVVEEIPDHEITARRGLDFPGSQVLGCGKLDFYTDLVLFAAGPERHFCHGGNRSKGLSPETVGQDMLEILRRRYF